MTVLLGMAALVLDVGSWYRADRATQTTADAAALAAAQALPDDPAYAVDLAVEYGDKNGGSVEAADVSFSSKWVPNDTVRVHVARPAPGFFAKLFGVDSVTVGSRASARAGTPSQALWVAPIVVNEKHPMLQNCKPDVCDDSTELDYYNLKEGGKKDDEGLQNDGAGSFGFINLDTSGGPNPGTSELGRQIREGYDKYMPLGDYAARTGNPFSSSNVGGELENKIGEELLFPIYRKLTGTGSNAKYEIIGWVGFRLSGLDLTGNKEKLFGTFTRVIWQGIQGSPGSSVSPGVRVVQLVD
ncbi:MAG: pilus assembly protein TadG-related protein [Actinomycetota bacterium]|nr:pilus assembly protein TadG-related protein [Actinomycetota bacterium]